MSKSLGSRQAKLPEIIDQRNDAPLDTFQLARMIYHPQAAPNDDVVLTKAQATATHRALRGLLKRGLIEDYGYSSLGRTQWRKIGSRDRGIEKAVAELEAIIATQEFAAARRSQWKLLAAMANPTSIRGKAGVLGVSKSTILRHAGRTARRVRGSSTLFGRPAPAIRGPKSTELRAVENRVNVLARSVFVTRATNKTRYQVAAIARHN